MTEVVSQEHELSGCRRGQLLQSVLGPLSAEGMVVFNNVVLPEMHEAIDHVVVAPSGMHIVDAKFAKKPVSVRASGTTATHLYLGHDDRTSLVQDLSEHLLGADAALNGYRLPAPVTPVLCFVGASWPEKSRGYEIDGIHIVWPKLLMQLIRRPGPLTPELIELTGQRLTARLRSA